MTTKQIPEGPFGEARLRLLQFADTFRLKNETLLIPLAADWSPYTKMRAAYVLGVIWGRLRQMNSSLEDDSHYADLVKQELDDE